MPSKYYLRQFHAGHYYHIYNRGAGKQSVFLSDQDFRNFIEICKYYILFPQGKALSLHQRFKVPNLDVPKSLTNQPVNLVAYCLMPNHFHFLIKQNLAPSPTTSITNFMRRLCITYALYFQEQHKHSGALFQGKYKSILVDNDAYLLHLSRYIHLNPLELINHPQAPHSAQKLPLLQLLKLP